MKRSLIAAGLLLSLVVAGTASAQTIVWDGNLLYDNNPNGCNDAATGGFLESNVLFGSPFTHNRVGNPLLINPGSLSAPNFRPDPTSPALCANGAPVIALPHDGFFQQTKYMGAFSADPAQYWLTGAWISYDPDGNPAEFNLGKPLVILPPSITGTMTLSNANNYLIQGSVRVRNGAHLIVPPGTVLFGSTTVVPSYVAVERGGRIDCNGTRSNPVIWTSERAPAGNAVAGDWGGLILLGKACANCANTAVGDSCQSEGAPVYYGGTDDHDDSGTVTFTRIEFSGYELAPNNEINCLTMNAVGDRTLIAYVQCHRGSDDCFEWFGGTVNCKYLLATQKADDGLDFQMGYRGKVQFAVVQEADVVGADKGIEGDNNEFNFGNPLCRSNPKFANVTFIGPRTTAGPGALNGTAGIHFRRGARGQVLNCIVQGYRQCAFDFDDNETTAGGFGPDGNEICPKAVKNENIFWDGNVVFNNNPNGCNDGALGGFTEDQVLFTGGIFTHNRQVDPLLVNAASLLTPNFRPQAASGALCANFHPVITVKDDGFFEQTNYAGGLDPDPTKDWTTGWVSYDPDGNPADFNMSKPLVVLAAGNLADGFVFKNTNNYLIQGRVGIVNSRIAFVQAGTVIFGSTTVVPSFLSVERGGKILANGTREFPIIMTSERAPAGNAAAGDWGGMVFLGRACANCANTAAGDSCQSEGAPVYYGGTDDEDNSGSFSFARIEFCGFELAPNNELNCLTMNAVGQGTGIDWISTHRGSDDLFEWFGGTVRCKYLIGTAGADDGLDFQMGYRGEVQFSVIQQADVVGVDKGIEGDNNEFNFSNALCRSNPQYWNCTFIGTRTTNGPGAVNGGPGIHFRRGARGEVCNSIVMGFRQCGFDFDDAETVAGGFAPNGTVFCSTTSGVIGDIGNGSKAMAARAFPNPVRASSRIFFNLPEPRQATVKVFTLGGQLVQTLADRPFEAGENTVDWTPDQLPEGIYFYAIDAGNLRATGKLVYVR